MSPGILNIHNMYFILLNLYYLIILDFFISIAGLSKLEKLYLLIPSYQVFSLLVSQNPFFRSYEKAISFASLPVFPQTFLQLHPSVVINVQPISEPMYFLFIIVTSIIVTILFSASLFCVFCIQLILGEIYECGSH